MNNLLSFKDSTFATEILKLKSNEIRKKFHDEINDINTVRKPKCISLDDEPFIAPLDYIWDTGGKHTRAMITQYLTNLFGTINNKIVDKLIYAIEVAHNISLIIDDVEDNTTTRRGELCAHKIFGKAFTVNAAYYIIFKGLSGLACQYDIDDPDIRPGLQQELLKLALDSLWEAHLGQGYDLLWTADGIVPTMDDFLQMVSGKTGVAFYYLAEATELIARYDKTVTRKYTDESIEKIKNLMRNIGIFYQLRDDYINITSPKYWMSKGFCEDFDEKKVSFLFVLLNEIDPNDKTFKKLHKLQHCSNKQKLDIYRILETKGVLIKAYNYLREMKSKIENLEKSISDIRFIYSFFSKIEIDPPLNIYQVQKLVLLV